MTQESALAWYKKVYAWKEPQTKVRSDTLVAACFFFYLPVGFGALLTSYFCLLIFFMRFNIVHHSHLFIYLFAYQCIFAFGWLVGFWSFCLLTYLSVLFYVSFVL